MTYSLLHRTVVETQKFLQAQLMKWLLVVFRKTLQHRSVLMEM